MPDPQAQPESVHRGPTRLTLGAGLAFAVIFAAVAWVCAACACSNTLDAGQAHQQGPNIDLLSGWHPINQIGWAVVALATAVAGLVAAAAYRALSHRATIQSSLHPLKAAKSQQEQEIEHMLNGMREILFRLDADGVITAVNPRWETLTGWAPNDLVGQPLVEWVTTDHQREVEQALNQPAGQTTQLLTHLRCKNGTQLSVEMHLTRLDPAQSALSGYSGLAHDLSDINQRALRDTWATKSGIRDEHGRPQGLVGDVQDMTDGAKAQRAMENARDAAAASDTVKSNFIANVSHELRTPLQSVLGFSELALRRQLSPEKQRAVLEDIYSAGQRMLKLVNEILDISRLESNVTQLETRPGDLCAMVREVTHELTPIALQRNVPLRLELPDAGLPSRFNAFRLGQVVRNVLANALRFSPHGSAVVVRVQRDQQGHLITVRDHGPGVPKSELESIFEPFTQSTLTSDGSGGTGLGLTISRSIMKAHQGRIWAENATGGGALFCIWLPGTPPMGSDAPSTP